MKRKNKTIPKERASIDLKFLYLLFIYKDILKIKTLIIRNFCKSIDFLKEIGYYITVRKRRSYPLLTLTMWKKVSKYLFLVNN